MFFAALRSRRPWYSPLLVIAVMLLVSTICSSLGERYLFPPRSGHGIDWYRVSAEGIFGGIGAGIGAGLDWLLFRNTNKT
jgi:hypothetical protein